MPDSGMLIFSLVCLVVGVVLFLYPQAIMKLSGFLNRTLTVLDQPLIRKRYFVGLMAFIASYAFFKLAFWVPLLKG